VGEGEENTAPILVPGQTPQQVSPGSLPHIAGSEDERSSGSHHVHADTEETAADVLLDEVRRAESKFPLGYVGVNFFVTRWQASQLDPDPDVRRRIIDRLVRDERIELYTTDDGTKAMRVKRVPSSSQSGSHSSGGNAKDV
jgi:hypothetical protein